MILHIFTVFHKFITFKYNTFKIKKFTSQSIQKKSETKSLVIIKKFEIKKIDDTNKKIDDIN